MGVLEPIEDQQKSGGLRNMTMKRKGKPPVPIEKRGAYNNMLKAESAMKAQRSVMQKNLPVFEVFCRTKKINIWYPCGNLAGDERAKATVDALMSGFLSNVYRSAMEKGIAESVLGAQKKEFRSAVQKMYPQLAKSIDDLEYGFKVKYKPLEEKNGPSKIVVLTEDMRLGAIDKLKKFVGL